MLEKRCLVVGVLEPSPECSLALWPLGWIPAAHEESARSGTLALKVGSGNVHQIFPGTPAAIRQSRLWIPGWSWNLVGQRPLNMHLPYLPLPHLGSISSAK